jgi:hypothetical protein
MSSNSTETTVDRAINFTRSLADLIDNLCPRCQDIIKEELTGTQPASSRKHRCKTTAVNEVHSYYDQQT